MVQYTTTYYTFDPIEQESLKDVDAICNKLNGAPPSNSILGCYDPRTQTIYAVEPTSFNDGNRLLILGHEFWHALGAEHP